MRYVIAFAMAAVMLLAAGVSADPLPPATQPAAPDLQLSKPVRDNGADFEAVAQAKWVVPPLNGKTTIEMGLKVTNRTEKMLRINVFDTVQIHMEDLQGLPLDCVKVRDATFIPEPLLLKSGESQVISRKATLAWIENARGLRLSGPDGAGGTWHIDIPQPGKYPLRFSHANNDERLKSVLARPAKHAVDPKEAPFWMGKITTPEMTVEVVEVPTQAPAVNAGR
ncbi:MAG: hypothetical protein ACHRHE_15465 [Tepidisphaerales bacterium]